MTIKVFVATAAIVLLALQYRFWFADSGFFARRALQIETRAELDRAEVLSARNQILKGEVLALRSGLDAVEARARTQLGMIKEGESFFVIDNRAER